MRQIGVICGILFSIVSGRVIFVPDSFPTIQSGLNAALGGDTVLVSSGIYYEQIVWPGRDGIRLYSAAGSDSTVIDGNGAGPVITFPAGVSRLTELRGFTITGGRANQAAGIYCRGSPAILSNRITGNVCGGERNYGAGIFCDYQSAPLIRGNEILRNRCSGSATWNYGGGIFIGMNSTPEIAFNLIQENECSDGYWNYGAGIYCDLRSTPFIYGNVIQRNRNHTGDRGHGAGIAVETQARALIFCNLIAANRNECPYWNYGAGVKVAGTAALVNNTIVNNICSGGTWNYGGGIYVETGDSALVKNNIIVQNSASAGGGIYNLGYLYNLYNDVWNNSGGNYYGCSAGPGDISLDPLFVTGAQGSYYLSQTAAGQPQTSPCVDAGDTLLWTFPANLDSMLRSFTTRTDSVPDGNVLDLGYHYPTTLSVGISTPAVQKRTAVLRITPTVFQRQVIFDTGSDLLLRIRIFDRSGRLVEQISGSGTVNWDGSRQTEGVYFYQIDTPEGRATGRLIKI
ncbi:MAG: right-handed parallel beta-helix repeat-containing protein [candidate division WOR-3 bacterium]